MVTRIGLHVLFTLNDPMHLANFAFKILVGTFVFHELCHGHAIALIKAIYIIQA